MSTLPEARPLFHALVHSLRRLLEGALALLILFEEWGWEPLQQVLAAIGRWPGFRWIEARIQRLPPGPALLLFALPTLTLLPIKLLALGLIAQGHALLGLAVIVAAKLVGTAVLARLFTLTRPALMQLAWFARLHGRWVAWKDAVIARLRASRTWREAAALRRQLRRRWQAWRRGGEPRA